MQTVDVLVVGAGLAGLHTARLLARRDLDVLVVDRRRSLSSGIRTTGIFVRRTLDDFDLPDHLLGPGVRDVLLYPPSRRAPIRLTSDRDEYRVADMAAVYEYARRAAEAAGARVRLGVRYEGASAGLVRLAGAEPVTARFIVGADGARSRVARDLGLDVNRRFLVGAELVHPIAPAPPSRRSTVCWIPGSRRATWAGSSTTAGTRTSASPAIRRRCAPAYATCSTTFAADAPGRAAPAGPVERRGGPIPVGGVLRRLACPAGLLVGDAAGAVSPLTAGGLDPCLRMSELAAAVTAGYLRTGDQSILRRYDGSALRTRFRGRLLLRRVFAGIRSPAAAEAAVALLRGRAGRALAARILFGDGSFPDVTVDVGR